MSPDEARAQPLMIGLLTVDEVIASHLVNCDQCRAVATRAKPAHLGQVSGHCGEYWHLHVLRARHEGTVNNIVAHTEHGDEAANPGQLEARQID